MMTIIALSLIATISNVSDADSAMARKDYTAAVGYYRAEVAAHPDAYDAKFNLARALSFTNQRDEAIRLYTELLATRPGNSDLLLARGRTYTWQDRWSEAEADLTAVTKQSPDYADAWSALGDMYLWSNRPIDAAGAYGHWIAVKPDDPLAYIARAKAFRSAGNYAAARADFEAARGHGASSKDVDEYLASLEKRRTNQEAEIPSGYKWSGSYSQSWSDFAPEKSRSEWHDYTGTIRRHFSRGSLGFEYLSEEHFDVNDDAFALDAYVDLWSRSYANLRYQYSPDGQLYPDNSYRAEIWQGVGKGWELSGSYDHMNFGKNNVDMYGAGLGKYVGNFYLRWRTLFIPSTARLGISHRALARYYFSGNADDYVEINGGFGSGGDFVRNTTIVTTTRSSSVGGAIQKYFLKHWGVKVSGGYSDDHNSFVERDVAASLLTRW